MERENLTSDDKGIGASGSNREAKSTDALARGGLPRSSVEVVQWPRSEGGRSSPLGRVNRQREEPDNQWKAVAFVRWQEPYESRGSRTVLRGARGEIPRAYSAKPTVATDRRACRMAGHW
jgi:hypothetical protein